MKSKKQYLFALFDDFSKARDAVIDLKVMDLKDLAVEDIEVMSPIEHPEVEEMLGPIDPPVQRFTFFGGITGAICGFLLAAAVTQAVFTVQPQGGKPVIPIPTDIIIIYEMTIMFGVYSTVFAFLYFAGLPRRLKNRVYSEKVSEDQIGILVELIPEHMDEVRDHLQKGGAVEIREGNA